MLLAEIHGKRFPEAEGQEDWMTSAVFGDLRHVRPGVFWPSLFQRARSVGEVPVSLASELSRAGASFDRFTELTTLFWRDCLGYGEPDLILRFTGQGVCPLVVLIEVKLNSAKSGVGEDDQLARYLALLDDPSALPAWACGVDHRYVIYLTRTFAKLELEDSVRASKKADAVRRIFGLEWRDVLETAENDAAEETMLMEVAEFLKGRGFEAFRGLRRRSLPSRWGASSFYRSGYFRISVGVIWPEDRKSGKFYGC